MSSQDDQISEKRRRLFKALSAVPVVATLKPGEALANSSAYQCLDNIEDPGKDPRLVLQHPKYDPYPWLGEDVEYYPKKDGTGYYIYVGGSKVKVNNSKYNLVDGNLYHSERPGVAITGFCQERKHSGKWRLFFRHGNSGPWTQYSTPRKAGKLAKLGTMNGNIFEGKPHPAVDPNLDHHGMTGTCLASFNGISQSAVLNPP